MHHVLIVCEKRPKMDWGTSAGGKISRAGDIRVSLEIQGQGQCSGIPLVISSHLYGYWNESNAGYGVMKKGITCDWIQSAHTSVSQPSCLEFESSSLYILLQIRSSQPVGISGGKKAESTLLAITIDLKTSSDWGISASRKVWVQFQPTEGPDVWSQGVLAWDLGGYLGKRKLQAGPKIHKELKSYPSEVLSGN